MYFEILIAAISAIVGSLVSSFFLLYSEKRSSVRGFFVYFHLPSDIFQNANDFFDLHPQAPFCFVVIFVYLFSKKNSFFLTQRANFKQSTKLFDFVLIKRNKIVQLFPELLSRYVEFL